MSMRRAAPLLLLLCVTAAEARAECMAPSPAIFPLGDVVPADPWMFAFVPAYQADATVHVAHADGTAPEIHVLDVSTPETGVKVWRIAVKTTRDFTMRIGEHGAPRSFAVLPRNPQLQRTVDVEGVEFIDEAWTCSHTTGLAISLRGVQVSAVRARWSDGTEVLVPPNDRGFFMYGAMGGEIDPAALRVLLGHPNCVANVIPDRYIGRRDVTLTALFSDGKELEVPLERKQAEPEPPRTDHVCGYAYAEQQRRAQELQRQRDAHSHAPWWIAGAAGIGGLVTMALVLLVRRRRITAVI